MTRFVVSRLLQALVVLGVMSFVIYGLIGLMPGDPIDVMITANPELTQADADRLRARYGLDRPIIERYGAWAADALSGDFGYSRVHARPVLEVLLPRLGNTLLLLGTSLVLAVSIAVPLGVMAALRPSGWADTVINLGCFAGISVPPFWLALLMMMLFAVTLGWLPAGGMGSVGVTGFWESLEDRVRHLALPVLTLTLVTVGGYIRYVRAAMMAELRQDYVRTAEAKGVGRARLVWRHALRNALIPLVTVLALDFGMLFSGALITETMFAYLGMGKLIYDSILGNDFNLALVGLLVATVMTLIGSFLADIAYVGLDPRVSYAGSRV